MNRNPNDLGPRQLRDCTFQDWADPIERPAPKHKTSAATWFALVGFLAIWAWALL